MHIELLFALRNKFDTPFKFYSRIILIGKIEIQNCGEILGVLFDIVIHVVSKVRWWEIKCHGWRCTLIDPSLWEVMPTLKTKLCVMFLYTFDIAHCPHPTLKFNKTLYLFDEFDFKVNCKTRKLHQHHSFFNNFFLLVISMSFYVWIWHLPKALI